MNKSAEFAFSILSIGSFDFSISGNESDGGIINDFQNGDNTKPNEETVNTTKVC